MHLVITAIIYFKNVIKNTAVMELLTMNLKNVKTVNLKIVSQ